LLFPHAASIAAAATVGVRVRGVDQRSDAGCVCAVSAHNANELYYVMANQRERRQAGRLLEPRRSELVTLDAAVG
jgi:hypothetical protein